MSSQKKTVRPQDISSDCEQLTTVPLDQLVPLPHPYEDFNKPLPQLTEDARQKYELVDDTLAVGFPKPETPEEEAELVKKFLSGVEKLLTKENNWTFLQPLLLTLDHCAKCQTCNDACPVYEMSGGQDIYRPTYRAEVLRKIINTHVKKKPRWLANLAGEGIDLNWKTIGRLLELSYRCTICRRCAQTCPVGVDNGLITHELRKIFSMEMGIAAKEIHRDGSVQQMRVGSSTGMLPVVVKDNVEFIDEEMTEKVGFKIETPWDKEGADVLILHNAGEFLAWPENPGATAVILEAAGVSWTLSSEMVGYDAINYGLWYDDSQFARVALKHAAIAKKLGVKKIVIGECGHAHKALTVIADRIFGQEYDVPRESILTFLADLICDQRRLKLDPSKNDFPVTLHDPCNISRLMGIVQPQRRIIKEICPQFREMTPHGVENYCCGGGSGFAIMSPFNFQDWRLQISGRKKVQQVLNAFADTDLENPEQRKYLCAPCSNCKGQLRDLLEYYEITKRSGIFYGGLVELIVNAMVDVKEEFIEWEEPF
ncbi:MAG: (Fe-S)-binding protein [bacterium]